MHNWDKENKNNVLFYNWCSNVRTGVVERKVAWSIPIITTSRSGGRFHVAGSARTSSQYSEERAKHLLHGLKRPLVTRWGDSCDVVTLRGRQIAERRATSKAWSIVLVVYGSGLSLHPHPPHPPTHPPTHPHFEVWHNHPTANTQYIHYSCSTTSTVNLFKEKN